MQKKHIQQLQIIVSVHQKLMTLEMLVRSVWQHVPNVLMEIAVIHAKKHIQQLQIIVSVWQELMTLEKLVRTV